MIRAPLHFIIGHLFLVWFVTELVVLIAVAVWWPWPPQLPKDDR